MRRKDEGEKGRQEMVVGKQTVRDASEAPESGVTFTLRHA